jgi:D-sedoheptulose 7-phosphate isomerase
METNQQMNEFISQYLADLKRIFELFPREAFRKIVNIFLDAYDIEKHIFVMGNGGSATTASHLACDINKGACFDLDKKFRVQCLNDNIPIMLAYSNDLSYNEIYIEQLKNYFERGDVVLGISGSGNSENILKAVCYALDNGGKTIGLCGFNGGKLSKLTDISLIIDSNDMQKVEDVHLIIVHMLMQTLLGILHHR